MIGITEQDIRVPRPESDWKRRYLRRQSTTSIEDAVSDWSIDDTPKRAQRRNATIYDAVAGTLINRDTRLDDNEQDTGRNPRLTKYSTSHMPFGPDEVLFRRKDAPQRYEEHDIYTSHIHELPASGQGTLPSSDLLKSIHSFASHMYSAGQNPGEKQLDQRSMDETALLAFGILLEEAGRQVLGSRGDMVFTEAARGDEVAHQRGLRINPMENQHLPDRKRRRVSTHGESP